MREGLELLPGHAAGQRLAAFGERDRLSPSSPLKRWFSDPRGILIDRFGTRLRPNPRPGSEVCRWLRPHPIPLLYEQPLAATPVQHCANTLLQLGGLVLIVMRRAFDPNMFLICCRKGRADRGIVRGGNGVVSQILDLQYGRTADAGGVLRSFRVRQIITPLREPGAQRRVSPEPGRRVVDGARITEIAPAGSTPIRIDAGIEPSHVAHRAVDHEAALDLARSPPSQRVEPLLAPLRDFAVACDLGRPKVLDELVSVRRLMRAGAVVDVECQFAPIRINLVGYRGIKPFGQGLGAGQMRGDEDKAIGRFQTGLRQV